MVVRQARGPRGLPVARRRGSPETRRAAVNILGFDARPRRRGRLGGRDRGPQRCLESYHQGQRRRPGQGGRRRLPPSRLPYRSRQGCQLAATARQRPEKPHPPQEQQYEDDAGFAPGTVPGATSKQTLSHRWGGVLRLRLRIPHTLGRFYATGLTVTFSGDDPLRTSLNGVRRGYWRVRGRLTKRFGPAHVPGLMAGLTRCQSEERLCSSRAAPRVNLLKAQKTR